MSSLLSSPAAVGQRCRLPPAAEPFQALPLQGLGQYRHRRCRPMHVPSPARGPLLPPPRAAIFDLAAVTELATAAAAAVQAGTDSLAAVSPAVLAPVVSTLGGDVASFVGLQPTLEGSARFFALYYALLARPGPFVGLVDFYLVAPLAKVLQTRYTTADFTLRDRLGSGNYGQVYEGLRNAKPGQPDALTRELTPEQKKRRVVLKKTNLDNTGIRANFLTVGTMARGAGESGQVESYMCQRIKLHPLVRPWAAEYLGTFVADNSGGGFTSGGQWLVWKFESDSTLADAINGSLGAFPSCLADIMLGSRRAGTLSSQGEDAEEKRDALVVKAIMRKLLQGMEQLHSLGIVHRDVKPDNIMITVEGEVKMIDFGAACDLSTGINYNPLYGMLDPRYAAPEELVMPKNVPRAPLPFLAALFAPIVWQYGRPDLFDTYAAGIILMQLAVPQLQTSTGQRNFNLELANADYDLQRWRDTSPKARQMDFSLLDRNGGKGWDLACKLVCKRDAFNRGRLSAVEALRHPFLLVPEF